MARGINLGAYDEKIFRAARRSITIKTYDAFEEFILQYRIEFNRSTAWTEFEKLVKKWKKSRLGHLQYPCADIR